MGFLKQCSRPVLISMFDAAPIKNLSKWVPKTLLFFWRGETEIESVDWVGGLVDSVVAKHICISGLWKPENVDQNEFRSCQNVKCLSAFTRISLPTCSFFLDSALTNFPCSMSFL